MADNEVKISLIEGASSGGSTGGSGAGSPGGGPSGGGGGGGKGSGSSQSGGQDSDDIGPKIPPGLQSLLNSLGMGNFTQPLNSLMNFMANRGIQNAIPVAQARQVSNAQAANIPQVQPFKTTAQLLAPLVPVGVGVAAGMFIIDQVKKKITDTVDTIGEVGKAIGGLNVHGFIEGMNKVMEKWGPLGEVAAHVSRAFFGVVQAVSETANKLSAYNGQLAAATAQANVAQIQGDIRRSQLLGPELSRFVEAQSRFEQAGQDLLAQFLRANLPAITAVLNLATAFFRGQAIVSDPATYLNLGIDAINGVINVINEAHISILPHLKNIDRVATAWERAQNQPGFAEGFWNDLFANKDWVEGGGPILPGIGGGPRPIPPRPGPIPVG